MAHKPNKYPWLIPYLIVRDVSKSIDFYQAALGFTLLDEPIRDDEGEITHAEMKYQDTVVMLGKEGTYSMETKSPNTMGKPCPINLCMYCADVDQLFQHAVKQGAIAVRDPENTFWGDRMASINDLDGYQWSIATYLAKSN